MATGRCAVKTMYSLPEQRPTGRNFGATMASGHLTQQLEKVRCCVISEAVLAARAAAGCCKPLVSPGAAPRASEQLAARTACLTAGEADPVQVAIQQARLIGVATAGPAVGMQVTAPSNSVYLKRKMDLIDDPRIVGPKFNQYANVQVPRPLPPCQVPPQRLPNAKEPIPVPQFKCALLNILVSN
jgi:hypothetical protein